MKPLWSRAALRHLQEVQRYIAAENPPASRALVTRIRQTAQRLSDFPESGEALHRDGLRAALVPGTPYRLIYAPNVTGILIIAVWHGAREWPFDTR